MILFSGSSAPGKTSPILRNLFSLLSLRSIAVNSLERGLFVISRKLSLICCTLLCSLCFTSLSACSASSAGRNNEPVTSGGKTRAHAVTPSTRTGSAEAAALQSAPGTTVSVSAVGDSPSPAAASPKLQAAPVTASGKDPLASPPFPDPATPTAAARVSAALSTGPGDFSGQVAPGWQPLLQRLQKDPKVHPEALRFFQSLPEYSPNPMGVKVKELFTSAFLRKKRVDDGKPKLPPSRIYRNVVTAATMKKCNDFLASNKKTFDAVEKKYPVPREIIVSLLFVETRLGTFVGKENALWSLACMAAANSPERVAGGLDGIPITSKHNAWLQTKLTEKSEWAYNELRALLAFCNTQELDPTCMPGSVYGAIGICQFMPSNLVPYGDDGDGDGVVNLFSEPDAIFSAARYLSKHGWNTGLSVDRQRGVLKRYNNLNIYANTILALAETMRTGVIQTGPPDKVKVASTGKNKKTAKK